MKEIREKVVHLEFNFKFSIFKRDEKLPHFNKNFETLQQLRLTFLNMFLC